MDERDRLGDELQALMILSHKQIWYLGTRLTKRRMSSAEEPAKHVEGEEEEAHPSSSPCTTLVVREPEQSVEPRPDLTPATIEEIASLISEHFGKAITECFERNNDSIKAITECFDARTTSMLSRFDAMEHRISASFDRFGDAMDRRFDALDSRFDAIDKKLGGLVDTVDDVACMTDRRDVKRARLGDL